MNNLYLIQDLETLVITSPKCNDTILASLDGHFRYNVFKNTDKETALNQADKGAWITGIQREIEVDDKVFVTVNNPQIKQYGLYCIEASENGLQISMQANKRAIRQLTNINASITHLEALKEDLNPKSSFARKTNRILTELNELKTELEDEWFNSNDQSFDDNFSM